MIQKKRVCGAGGGVLVGMFVVLFLAVSAGAQEPSFCIADPNGGETFNIGGSEVITWWASDFSEEERAKLAKLELWQNNRKIGTIKSDLPIQPRGIQSHVWRVGDYQGGTASAGSDYKIRVSTMDGTVWDESNNPFTLRTNSLTLRILHVIAPRGGETWNIGERETIRWEASGFSWDSGKRAKLELWQNNRKIGTIKSDLPIQPRGSQAYAWEVGDYQGGTASAGSGYKIRVSTTEGAVWDESDRPFTLRAVPQPQTGSSGLQTHPPGLQRGGPRQLQH
jgi:hypothetical protein